MKTVGTAVEIAGGTIFRCDEAALGGGTTITVRDLFFNVPVRQEIPAVGADRDRAYRISDHALQFGHPGKSFVLRHNNRTAGRDAGCHLARTGVSGLREPILDDLVDLGDQGRDLKLPVDGGEDGESIARRFRYGDSSAAPKFKK